MNENNFYQDDHHDSDDHSDEKEIDLDGDNRQLTKPLVEKLTVIEKETLLHDSYQFRALIRKMASLQWKQKGTNVCQICTPILSLMFVLTIKELLQNYIPRKTEISIDVPQPLNVQMITRAGLNTSSCLEVSFTISFLILKWFLYDFEPDVTNETREFIGFNHGLPLLRPNGSGLLSELLQEACFDYDRQVPYFSLPVQFYAQPLNDLQNTTINEDLYGALKILNKLDYKFNQDMPGLEIFPDGAITFGNASKNGVNFTLQINDVRSLEYHRNNGFTKIKSKNMSIKFLNESYPMLQVSVGFVSLVDLVTRTFMRQLTNQFYVITATMQMPTVIIADQQITRLLNLSGSTLFPLALSLLLPIFMYSIVLEKEERLISFMKMNGMQMWKYWMVNFIFDFGVYLFMVILFFLFGTFALDVTYFYQTSIWLQIIIYVGWGIGQIGLSFFWSAFITQAKTASITGYILAMFLTIVASTLNAVLWTKLDSYPWWMSLYPAFAYNRAVYNCTEECGNLMCYETLSMVHSDTWTQIILLYVTGIVYLLLGTYLNEVLQQQYGVKKKWNFFMDWFRSTEALESHISQTQDCGHSHVDEDEDCLEVRQTVKVMKNTIGKPLVVKNMRQVYKYAGEGEGQDNVAVKCMNLVVKKGETFGLLGPNGAGKTTLISMITGLYDAKQGNAWIGQFDVVNNLRHVQRRIGVCPQFNILWGELTIEEHLYFYARLKGITPANEKESVDWAVKQVGLVDFAEYKANQLSGGMQRRLSIAISLVGEPDIIFLDEPSTGLDPKHRRQVWDILTQEEFRHNKTLLITTHSMEEADVLCNRIGIMTKGSLRCIGNTLRLKNKFGGGYHLFVNCKRDKHDQEEIKRVHQNVKNYIAQILPQSKLAEDNNGNFTYKIPLEGLQVSQLFDKIETQKSQLGIADWGISQCTLEDVFLRIVQKHSKEDAES